MLFWSNKLRISHRDLVFIADLMSVVQIKNYLAEYNSDFGSSCSIQKFTNLFKRCLPYLRRLYDVSEDNERRAHRTRYNIRKK